MTSFIGHLKNLLHKDLAVDVVSIDGYAKALGTKKDRSSDFKMNGLNGCYIQLLWGTFALYFFQNFPHDQKVLI